MWMTEEEIVKSYRSAKNKKGQITILAQLNAVTAKKIEAVIKKRVEAAADKTRAERAVELYGQGLEPRMIAERFNVSVTTVNRYLRAAGLKQRAPNKDYVKLTDALRTEIDRLRGEGLSGAEIARRTGVSGYQVYTHLKLGGGLSAKGRGMARK